VIQPGRASERARLSTAPDKAFGDVIGPILVVARLAEYLILRGMHPGKLALAAGYAAQLGAGRAARQQQAGDDYC
jgi:hypothetical protein